ncbi:hypothetical protein FPZ43_12195 [Mucilaginibacter pallidiroseus]|uniref:Uncharacterized protein n=1 Tax=Mucilaginibacter pallidiroseus TaxID=2599295 RepID=A0A563UCG3_9SPHI|nr:hypothetical protein FPZ43_12195 [Mucilaginibacter pallidiroseus]
MKKAIGVSLNGYKQKFYVPFTGNNADALTAAKANAPLRIKCTVYRFFTVDGVSNFFYVDKIL